MEQNLQVLVGLRILEGRRAAGLTQVALAKLVDSAPRTLQTWEAGERLPRAETLQMLAEVLGQPVSWFYTEYEVAA